MDLAFKKRLHEHCSSLIIERIERIQNELNSAQESIANDSKSTAGDKHETSRAMLHLEQEKDALQLADAQKLLRILSQINLVKGSRVQMGSLVQTDKALFYISVALGKIEFENQELFAISPVSPLAQKFLSKAAGDSIAFNSTNYSIGDVC